MMETWFKRNIKNTPEQTAVGKEKKLEDIERF